MNRTMHKFFCLLGSLGVFIQSNNLWASANDSTAQIEIDSFRYSYHAEQDFERLVISFNSPSRLTSKPPVRLQALREPGDYLVSVSEIILSGEIPESAINKSYTRKSKYLGPLAFNADDPNGGFSIRTYVKDSDIKIEAFWEENPNRLVLDVFPKHSLRIAGPQVVSSRNLASHNSNPRITHKKPQANRELSSLKEGENILPQDPKVLCFPANSQLNLSVGFKKRSGTFAAARVNLESGLNEHSKREDAIACFPVEAQLAASLHFYDDTERNKFAAKSAVKRTIAKSKAKNNSETEDEDQTEEYSRPVKKVAKAKTKSTASNLLADTSDNEEANSEAPVPRVKKAPKKPDLAEVDMPSDEDLALGLANDLQLGSFPNSDGKEKSSKKRSPASILESTKEE